jgi:tRNA G10  N-methylase Trm11
VTYLLAICARQPGNALIAAECKTLTGGAPDANGIAACERIDLIPQAAFVLMGLRRIASTGALSSLTAAIREMDFSAEDFRIELLRTPQAQALQRQEAIIAIANALKAYPNLDAPRHRFMLVARQERLDFCEIVTLCGHDYQRHTSKPYHTSSSLPAQLARGMVNLAPKAQSVIDPCCGTGSILLEAQALGIKAVGTDRNPRMVGMARKNLAHYGYQGDVRLMDAREVQQRADAVVTDLPYGYMQVMEWENMRAILSNCANMAPLGVFAAGMDITSWLTEAGYSEVEVYPVRKRAEFTRYIHRAARS